MRRSQALTQEASGRLLQKSESPSWSITIDTTLASTGGGALARTSCKMNKAERKDHPVWAVYDLLRTVRLNELYYTRKLSRVRLGQKTCEIALAITAPSSAATKFFVDASYGDVIWQVLLGIASVLSVLQPILKLTDRIQKLESIASGYRVLRVDLVLLRNRIFSQRQYLDSHREIFQFLIERRADLDEREPLQNVDRSLRDEIESEVGDWCGEFFVPDE